MPQGAEISRILVSLAFLTVVVVDVEVVEAVVVVVVVSRFWRCSYQYAEAVHGDLDGRVLGGPFALVAITARI